MNGHKTVLESLRPTPTSEVMPGVIYEEDFRSGARTFTATLDLLPGQRGYRVIVTHDGDVWAAFRHEDATVSRAWLRGFMKSISAVPVPRWKPASGR